MACDLQASKAVHLPREYGRIALWDHLLNEGVNNEQKKLGRPNPTGIFFDDESGRACT